MSKNALVIGAGYMGKIIAKAWKELGFHVYLMDVIDKDVIYETVGGRMEPRTNNRREFASSLNLDFILMSIDLEKQCDEIFQLAQNCEVVSIASPTQFHIHHLNAVLKSGVKRILVEKPICLTKNDLALLDRNLIKQKGVFIAVNFIERAHPTFEAVKNFLRNPNTPWTHDHIFKDGLFWRQQDMRDYMRNKKCPPDHPWGFLRDSSHDVSEIHGLFRSVLPGTSILPVETASFRKWHEKYTEEVFQHPGDYACEVVFGSSDFVDAKYIVRGAKDNDELRRYFVLYNNTTFVFCSTLPRPNLGITPCVWISRFHPRLLALAFSDSPYQTFPMKNDEVKKLLEQYNGYEIPVTPSNPQVRMCQNLLNATSSHELYCSFQDGLDIDAMVMNAYEHAGILVENIATQATDLPHNADDPLAIRSYAHDGDGIC
ncbi:Gfo/Idh/MocA family oxidoreductase [Candidatus Falkowbacteria bacterium]|nr:Gfo/Idh/MocA family oxidoreductase [Candidatus Falkowbacteria bacterium]